MEQQVKQVILVWRQENATLSKLSIFWRSLKMLLINFTVELKLKWTNYCVLASNGADNDSFLPTETQNYLFPSSLYQQKTTKN